MAKEEELVRNVKETKKEKKNNIKDELIKLQFESNKFPINGYKSE